jgi:plastocyanin
MNTLDSRFLRLGDSFAHRFSVPGTFAYALSPIPTSLAAPPTTQSVIVAARDGHDDEGRQRQHDVTVAISGGQLHARPAELRVTAGDLVVWSADRSVTFGFAVRGQIGDEFVNSASLHTESIFTHAFGLPGTYEWADANGSGLRGQVRVGMPKAAADHQEWLSKLGEGTLVHVRGDRAKPDSVDILVGQTVLWALEDAPGVSITDTNLIGPADGTRGQTKQAPKRRSSRR